MKDKELSAIQFAIYISVIVTILIVLGDMMLMDMKDRSEKRHLNEAKVKI